MKNLRKMLKFVVFAGILFSSGLSLAAHTTVIIKNNADGVRVRAFLVAKDINHAGLSYAKQCVCEAGAPLARLNDGHIPYGNGKRFQFDSDTQSLKIMWGNGLYSTLAQCSEIIWNVGGSAFSRISEEGLSLSVLAQIGVGLFKLASIFSQEYASSYSVKDPEGVVTLIVDKNKEGTVSIYEEGTQSWSLGRLLSWF